MRRPIAGDYFSNPDTRASIDAEMALVPLQCREECFMPRVRRTLTPVKNTQGNDVPVCSDNACALLDAYGQVFSDVGGKASSAVSVARSMTTYQATPENTLKVSDYEQIQFTGSSQGVMTKNAKIDTAYMSQGGGD
jgi:hypothetical protein